MSVKILGQHMHLENRILMRKFLQKYYENNCLSNGCMRSNLIVSFDNDTQRQVFLIKRERKKRKNSLHA